MPKGIWINDREFISFAEKSVSLTGEIATRKGSIDFYSLGMALPDPDPVLRKAGKDFRVYRELTTDPRVSSGVRSRKSGVLSLEWEVDRGKAKSREAKVIAQVFGALKLNRILSEILDAALYGFQPLEILWENRDGLILPKDVVGKPPEWFRFSEENKLLLRTKAAPNGSPVPERKFLCPVYDGSYQNPYGERLLSRVFWPVTFKKGGLKFWVTFAEKFGTPWVIGKMPRGTQKDKTDDLAEKLEAMINDAVAVIPDDASVDIIEAAGKGASAGLYKELVDFCNTEISTVIVGHAGAAESTAGKLGGEDAAITVRGDIVDADKKLVEETMNQLVGWIHELNFAGAGAEAPRFAMWEEEDVDLDTATRDQTLSQAGVRFSKNYFVRAYGFEEEDIVDVGPAPTAPVPWAPQPPASFSERHCPHCSEARFTSPGQTGTRPFPDQAAIDDLVESIPPEELQAQMEGVLKPVLDLIGKGNSPEEILNLLSEAYPNMQDDALEEMLARAIFVSESWGQLNAAKA